MRKVFRQFWPLFFVVFIWVIFSTPYLLKNKVPYPSTYQVNFVPPWSYYEKFWGPVKNNAMPDIIGQIYPWRYFSVNMWKDGQIPFWNPYSFSGNPHIANYQSAAFSPFNILFFMLPFIDAWSILVLLQPLLAGIFMYFLMKEFKVSFAGSLISSVVFMFCGFIVVWMAYGTLSMAIAFLPLAILGIEKFYNTEKLRYLTILSLSIPLSFFSGHFQTSFYFLIFTLLFFIFKTLQTKETKKFILICIAIVSGLVISFPQIIPSIEFYSYSVRSEIFIKKGTGIPLFYLVNIFSPDLFGNPVTRNDWFGTYAEWASFIGIVPLVLSLFSLIGRRKNSAIFFLSTGLLSLLFAINSPLLEIISALKIPVLSTSNPTRIIVLFSFSFAVLAGFGLDNLRKLILKGNHKKIIIPFLIVGIILITSWFAILIIKLMPVDKLIIAKRNLLLPTGLFLGMLFLIFASLKYKKLFLFTILYLVLSVSYDSYRFASKWMPFDRKDLAFAEIPIVNMMKKNMGFNRYFGNLGGQVDSYYGFQSVEGYDPLYINKYGEFIQAAAEGNFIQSERSVVKLARGGKYTDRVLDILGVSLYFHPIADTNQGWAYPVWEKIEKYDLIYEDSMFQLFKNKTAMDRATLFYNYRVISNPRKLLEIFYTDNFDFRKTLLLEKDPGLKDIDKTDGKGSIKIISYTPNKIIIEVNTNKQALLFLSDNFYPGWKAKITSLVYSASSIQARSRETYETKIYRANYTFKAIIVPAGKSVVEFNYNGFSLL